MSSSVDEVLAVLRGKSCFETVDSTPSANQLRIVGRVPADAMSVNINNWLLVIRNILLAQTHKPWKADISKQYFLKGNEGREKVIYGWRVIFQGEDIANHYADIISVVLGAKHTSSSELTEFPLPGATADRNEGKNGKGARGIREAGR